MILVMAEFTVPLLAILALNEIRKGRVNKNQLIEYVEANPNDKLWLLAFSKGGIDTLHFLHDNREFAEKHVVGLSSIASPILGSEHEDHKLIQLMNKVHDFSDNKIYQFFDKKVDVLLKDFQQSLSSDYQKAWFKNNYQR